jgi:hypothetical protein
VYRRGHGDLGRFLGGGAFWIGATAAVVATRWAGGFTPGLFAAVGAVA